MNAYTMRNDCNTLVCKTLTLTEAIDMLPVTIWNEDNMTNDECAILKTSTGYYIEYYNISFTDQTLLQAVEKMLLYLHKQ